jgi:hypothetical protein
MEIENIKTALEILNKEISPKLLGTKELNLLANIVSELELLKNRLEDPKKSKKLDKLANG